MKKLATLLLALALLALGAGALAENEITWDMVEPQITQAGWEGRFVTFDEIAVKMWVPSVLAETELTEADRAAGYIGYYMVGKEEAAVAAMYVNLGGMDLETYARKLPEHGAVNVQMGIINGIPVVTYGIAQRDTLCVTMTTAAGRVLELCFAPLSNEGFAAVVPYIVASIQPE